MTINLLELKPHKVSRDLSGYLTYIYGSAKVGKTTLGSQMPKPLIIASERGYNALPGVIAQDVTSWSEMRQVYKELKKPEVKATFDSVVVDTIDILADMCQKYIMNQNDIDAMSQLPYGQAWVLFKNEFSEVFRGLAQLGYAVLFLGHPKEQLIGEGDNQTVLIRPALSASTREIIVGMCDIVGYAHQKNTNEMSVLTLRSPNDSAICGTRFKYMPNEITLSYGNLTKALQEAIDKEAAEHNGQFVTDEKMTFRNTQKEYNYDDMMKKVNEFISALMEKNQSNAVKITSIIEKYLGKGKKVGECTPNQCEQLELIIADLGELLA